MPHSLLLQSLPHRLTLLCFSAMNLDKFEKGPREIFHPEIQKVKEAMGLYGFITCIDAISPYQNDRAG